MHKASKFALVVAVVAALSQVSCAVDNQEQSSSSATTSSSTASDVLTLAKQLVGNQTSSYNSSILSSLVNNPLVSALTSNLNMTGSEAATGTAALLVLAANQLMPTQNSELNSIVPQLSTFTDLIPENLSNQLTTLSSVQNLFSGIGLESSKSDQIAPILIDSITDSGASSNLISSLTNLWQPY